MFDVFGNIFGRKKSQDQPTAASEALEEEFVMVNEPTFESRRNGGSVPPYPAVYPNVGNYGASYNRGQLQGNGDGPSSVGHGIEGIPFILNSSLCHGPQRGDLEMLLHKIEAVQQTLSLEYDYFLERSILRECRVD